MADNVVLNTNTTTGATIASDDIAGVQHQLVKIEYGDPDSATQVSATNRLPVATGLTQPTTPADTQPISAASLPLPTGAATAARQDTGNTSLGTIAGAVSGTEMQVDVLTLPATPTGDNTIGRVKITDGTDVADVLDLANSNPIAAAIVDGSGNQITSFGGGQQYADGAARGTATGTLSMGDDGVNIQSVHVDTAGDLQVDILSIAAGDNNIGNVDIVTMPAITGTVTANAGTNLNTSALNLEATQADVRTAVQLIDDTVKTLGTDTYAEATTKGLAIGAVRRDADTSAVNTDNEIAPLLVNAIGALKVEVFSGETLPVSGTVTTTATDLDIRNLVFATDKVDASGTTLGANSGVDIGDVTINNASGASAVNIQDGGNSLTVDAPIGTPVNVQVGNGTLAAGVIDETGASAVDALAVGGGTAHDAVDSGNPVKVGGVAVSGSATPTSVAAADRTRWIFNQHGIPYVMGGHPNLIVREFDFGTAAQTDLNLAAALVAADERIYVTGFEAMCDNANSVAVSVRAGFGTASVPAASATGVSGMIASHPGLAAGSGIVVGNGSGIIAVGGAGEEPRLTSSAATSGNLHVVIRYFLVDETP